MGHRGAGALLGEDAPGARRGKGGDAGWGEILLILGGVAGVVRTGVVSAQWPQELRDEFEGRGRESGAASLNPWVAWCRELPQR